MRRHGMMFAAALAVGTSFTIAIGAIALAAPAPSTPAPNSPQGLAAAAYTAMGNVDHYSGEGTPPEQLVIITTRGTTQQWEPGESESVADLTKPDGGTSTFVNIWDRTRTVFRTEWSRPRPAGGMRTYTEIYSVEGGYVLGNDANGAPPRRTVQGNPPVHTMSSLRLRALLREQERAGIVFSMHDHPDRIYDYPAQTVGGKRYPAVQFRGDNATFIVMFDPATHFPAVVRTRDFDQHMGDADFDATYSDWRDVGKFKQPYHVVYTLNGFKLFDTTVNQITVNTNLAADAFRAPPALRGKAALPAPIGKPNYQWILRRLASGFNLDSEAVYGDDGAQMALTDVGPNISLFTGGSHNTLVVATNNSLIAFEAPGDDGLSKLVIDAAAKKYPGKPFKYVVLTHHHIDHSGGVRAYAAEGATIVVGKGDGAFFRKVLSAPQGLNPYGVKSVAPKVIEVDGKWSVNEGGRAIEAYLIESPHAAGYLIPYVPDAKMGFVTDIWGPGAPVNNVNPAQVALVREVAKAGITPEKFAGGHGSVGNYSDLTQAVQRQGGGR